MAINVTKEVSESDIDPKLKAIMLDLLLGIQNCILDYKISGTEGFIKIIAEAYGRLKLEEDIVKENKDNEAFKSFREMLRKTIQIWRDLGLFYVAGDKLIKQITGQ